MPLLYFWRGDNYRQDLDYGAGYHLNQATALLHEIEPGGSLWAFTRRADGLYVLAAELVASAKTMNPVGFRYGRYRLWGDLRRSRYFAADGQPDITTLIRGLSVKSGTDVLGRGFQGRAAVRRLTADDHAVLAAYASRLPLEPRARLLPEERLEALIFSGDAEAVERLLQDEPAGLAEARRKYLQQQAPTRSRALVHELRDLYDGRCQVCGWAPRARYGVDVAEAHHVRWLSRGGIDGLSNLTLLCPNHHRAVHAADAPFDFVKSAFIIGSSDEALQLLRHELAA